MAGSVEHGADSAGQVDREPHHDVVRQPKTELHPELLVFEAHVFVEESVPIEGVAQSWSGCVELLLGGELREVVIVAELWVELGAAMKRFDDRVVAPVAVHPEQGGAADQGLVVIGGHAEPPREARGEVLVEDPVVLLLDRG